MDLLHSFTARHLGIRVPDVDSAKAWYVSSLGFRVVREWPYGDLRVAYLESSQGGEFHLELLGGGSPIVQPAAGDLMASLRSGGFHHFCWQVHDLDATVDELTRRGVNVIGEPFIVPATGNRLAFFTDPWGTVFQLLQAVD
jgi:glyoxylase I family protein